MIVLFENIDWDLVLSIVLGISALGYAWIEHRRTSKLDDVAMDHAERLAGIEAQLGGARSLAERVTELEARVDFAERLAVVEARMDHKPVTQTRRKDGKFASPDEVPK